MRTRKGLSRLIKGRRQGEGVFITSFPALQNINRRKEKYDEFKNYYYNRNNHNLFN